MTVNFTGIKNITVGRLASGTRLQTNLGEFDAQGLKATMYLDGKDLDSMNGIIANNRLEVATIRATSVPSLSGLFINGKPVDGALKNLPTLNKLGNIFNKILKTSNEKLSPSDEYLTYGAYIDIAGSLDAAAEMKKSISPNVIKTYFASAKPIKTVANNMIAEMKTSIAFESKGIADRLAMNRDIIKKPIEDIPN